MVCPGRRKGRGDFESNMRLDISSGKFQREVEQRALVKNE